MSTVTVPMDDAALFAAATSEEPPADVVTDQPAATETTTTEPEPQPSGQPRDEHGRWKEAKPEPAPQAAPEPVAEPPQQAKDEAIPPWRLSEVTRERNEARQQNAMLMQELGQMRAHLQPQPQRPDFFENPDAATQHHVREHVDPQLQAVRQQLQQMGQMLAAQKHGEQVVQAADDAFSQAVATNSLHPADYHRVMSSPNIYDAAVQWYKRHTALATVGDDPNAWFDRQLAERMKDPAFQAKQLEVLRGNVQQPGNGSRPASIVQLPPSISRTTAAAPNRPDDPGDMSDASLFRHAMAP